MATYQWQGKTRSGESRRGILVAESPAAATAQLRQQMIMPTSIRPKLKELSEFLPFLKKQVKIKQIVVFTRQFATMIDAGLPLVQCLEILANQQENAAFKQVLTAVKADVESGSTFSDALARHPKAFDRLYSSLVESGETGGILDTILTRLANYPDHSLEKLITRRKAFDPISKYPSMNPQHAGKSSIMDQLKQMLAGPQGPKAVEGYQPLKENLDWRRK